MSSIRKLADVLNRALEQERAKWRALSAPEWNIFGPDEEEENKCRQEKAFVNGRIDGLEQALRELNAAAIHPFSESVDARKGVAG